MKIIRVIEAREIKMYRDFSKANNGSCLPCYILRKEFDDVCISIIAASDILNASDRRFPSNSPSLGPSKAEDVYSLTCDQYEN